MLCKKVKCFFCKKCVCGKWHIIKILEIQVRNRFKHAAKENCLNLVLNLRYYQHWAKLMTFNISLLFYNWKNYPSDLSIIYDILNRYSTFYVVLVEQQKRNHGLFWCLTRVRQTPALITSVKHRHDNNILFALLVINQCLY